MAETLERPTAKIYAFPQRGRFASAQQHEADEAVVNIVYGSGWYHDEAVVQDAEVAGKR